MSTTIPVEITGRALELMQRIQDKRGALQAVAAAFDEENTYTVSHIQRLYLSFPKTGPTSPIGCRVQSNLLRGSLRASRAVVMGDSAVQTSIGSNVKYAAILEFGGTTRPHKITAKNGGALKFMLGGQTFLRKSVNHPGSKFPARGFVQRGIRDRLPDYRQAAGAAIIGFWEGGGR